MSVGDKALPEFNNPPVVEVALAMQFDAIHGLRTAQMGALWLGQFKERFPLTEEHPPIDPVFERFGRSQRPVRARIQVLDRPPIPRCWFLNEAGTELIQVQQTRFIHNWRKQGSHEDYPRYEHLRKTFANELNLFQAFIDREGLGSLIPNQCEVTYVNHIVQPSVEEALNPEQILAPIAFKGNGAFLPNAEDIGAMFRYVLHDANDKPIGRLHIVAEPAYRNDGQFMYVLTLTARLEPAEASLTGVLQTLDVGREWVVRGFADITTEAMHKKWERTA